MPADDLVGAWKTNLYAEKLSHRMRTNYRISLQGDTAEVFSKGFALNTLERDTGSDLWEVWGEYTHTLERFAKRVTLRWVGASGYRHRVFTMLKPET